MKCPNCSGPINEGQRFCGRCGATIPTDSAQASKTIIADETIFPATPQADINRTMAAEEVEIPSAPAVDINHTMAAEDVEIPSTPAEDINRTMAAEDVEIPSAPAVDINRTMAAEDVEIPSAPAADINRTMAVEDVEIPSAPAVDVNRTIAANEGDFIPSQYGDGFNNEGFNANSENSYGQNGFAINFNTEEAHQDNVENTETEDDDVDSKKKKKKKRKFKWGKFLLITIPALAVVAAIIFNLSWIIGFVLKTFAPPEKYLKFVQKKSATDTVEVITPFYDNLIEGYSSEMTYSVNIDANVSETLMSLVNAYMKEQGVPVDISKLTNAGFDGYITADGLNAQLKGDLSLGDTTITDIDASVDIESGDVYFGIPQLSKKYFHETFGGAEITTDEYAALVEIIKDVAPSGKQIGYIVGDLSGIPVDYYENAEKESYTLEVGDISQKVTALSYEIPEGSSYDSEEALYKELQENKHIKKFIEKFQEKCNEKTDLLEDMDGDLYSSFVDFLDDQIEYNDKNRESWEEWSSERDGDYDGTSYMTVYVNGKHEIVGMEQRSKSSSGGEYASFMAIARDGDDFSIVFKETNPDDKELVLLEGSGTDDGKVINCDLTIYNGSYKNNKEVITLSIQDFDRKAFDKGYINGTMVITPSEEIVKNLIKNLELPSDVADMLSASGIDLVISVNYNEDETNINISLEALTEKLVTINTTIKKTDFTEASTPSSSTSFVGDMEELMSSVNLFALAEKLKKAGLSIDFSSLF